MLCNFNTRAIAILATRLFSTTPNVLAHIAMAIHAPQRSVVRKYKGEPEPANLETTEVTATETDLEALKKHGDFGVDRTRLDAPSFNRGLFFVPR